MEVEMGIVVDGIPQPAAALSPVSQILWEGVQEFYSARHLSYLADEQWRFEDGGFRTHVLHLDFLDDESREEFCRVGDVESWAGLYLSFWGYQSSSDIAYEAAVQFVWRGDSIVATADSGASLAELSEDGVCPADVDISDTTSLMALDLMRFLDQKTGGLIMAALQNQEHSISRKNKVMSDVFSGEEPLNEATERFLIEQLQITS